MNEIVCTTKNRMVIQSGEILLYIPTTVIGESHFLKLSSIPTRTHFLLVINQTTKIFSTIQIEKMQFLMLYSRLWSVKQIIFIYKKQETSPHFHTPDFFFSFSHHMYHKRNAWTTRGRIHIEKNSRRAYKKYIHSHSQHVPKL